MAESIQGFLSNWKLRSRLTGSLKEKGKSAAFSAASAAAAWQDMKLEMRYMKAFARIAVVSDKEWICATSRFFGAMMPIPVKVYPGKELAQAKTWLTSASTDLSYVLDRETGVLAVEVKGPLSSEDFEVMTNRVDSWLENESRFKGIVVHARRFPGWENLGSFFSHVEFIRGHHKKIERIALAVDGLLPELAQQIAKRFVNAEVKHFAYEEFDRAKSWVAGKSANSVKNFDSEIRPRMQ